MHPALLDACFQSVAAHPDVQAAGSGGLMLPLGVRRLRAYGSARNARYCYIARDHRTPAGIEADLDVLDEHGTVLLTVQGLQLGTGASESGNRDRVLNERLLTIEWQQRSAARGSTSPTAGPWLLISTSDAADVLATKLTDALKLAMARTARPCRWPQQADHPKPTPEQACAAQLGAGGFDRRGGPGRAASRRPG